MARDASMNEAIVLDKAGAATAADAAGVRTFEISTAHRIAEVEAVWRTLTAGSIESPGQSCDFIRLWCSALGVSESNQFYITAWLDGTPLALVPLQRRWDKGMRVLSWFPGPHVGCNAPIADVARLRRLAPEERRRLWIAMLRGIAGADVVYLKSVPELIVDGVDLLAELGQSIEADTLYRANFASFDEADRTQRNKSRRKHDRQQGDKLEAMGAVTFEEIDNGPEAVSALETLFQQRSARFREMGVFDPFAIPRIRAFYDSTAAAGSGVPVKLHVLRLDGAIVAMRYSVAHGDRLFCLISSMSEEARLRPGSPGKQCLLRVMQTVYGEGYRVFDMGEGLTDEKRHWCNEQIPVRHFYMPITRRGALAATAHRGAQTLKRRIKNDERLLAWAKGLRATLFRLNGRQENAGPEQRPES